MKGRIILRKLRLLPTVILVCAQASLAQTPSPFKYFYSDSGQLTKVIDSSGNEIDYTYDAVGNILQVTRTTAPASGTLAILNFTPQSGPVGTTVTIEGQNFSATPASNALTFNGTAATVLTATASTLTAAVPSGATTGPIAVTVAGVKATSTTSFTVIPGPAILSVSPRYLVSSSSATSVPSFQVTGVGLAGATFAFVPAFNPAPVTVNSATINAAGTSATLNLAVAANTVGSFALVASNTIGTSTQVPNAANTLQIITPDGDADGDGLTNAVEIAIGTNPLNPQTSGDGLPDGWQLFYGLNPLDSTVAGQDVDKSGLTILQDFEKGLSPINPNLVPPAVSQVNPRNGATAIPINDVVVLRFGEPLLTGTSLVSAQNAIAAALAPTAGSPSSLQASSQAIAAQTLQAYMNRTCCGNSVIAGTVTLTAASGAISGSVTPSSDGLSATFSPTQQLASNTVYTVQANGVRDSAGNLMTVPFTSSFTTGSGLDTTPPTVVRYDPENQSTNVPINVHYTVQFSKEMNPATLTPANFTIVDTTTNTPVTGIVQVDASGLVASFVPNPQLSLERQYSVTLSSGIQDTAGNNLAAVGPFSFTTSDQPETVAPHLAGNAPQTGMTNVGTNALVVLRFSEALDIVTVAPNVSLLSGSTVIPVLVALSGGDQIVTLTPAVPLSPSTTYTVLVAGGIADLAGLTLDNPGTFTFTTGVGPDTTQGSIVSIDPSNGTSAVPLNAIVQVGFSKPVAGGDVSLYPNVSYGTYYPLAGVGTISPNGMTFTLAPSAPLQQQTQYCISVTGVTDLEGQSVSNGQSCFTTGTGVQSTGPAVASLSPATGSTNVPLNTMVAVTVNEPVSLSSVGNNAITVTSGGVAVPGLVAVSGNGTVLTYSTALLAPGTTYTVSVGGFIDLAGNTAMPFTGTFTTAASSTFLNVSTGLSATGALILTGGTADGHWTVVPTSGTPPNGTFSASGTPQPLRVVSPENAGFYAAWPNNGPNSSWININPNSVTGNTFGVYSTTFTIAGTSVPANLCLVGAMGVDDNGQLGINGQAIMNQIDTSGLGNLSPVLIPISNYLVTGKNTLSLGWGNTDNSYEAFRLQASIASCSAAAAPNALTVLTVSPANNAVGVSVKSSVVVTFSEAVNAATVNNQSVRVTANGNVVAGSYAVAGAAVTFTPLTPLPGDASISVSVDDNASVEDFAGNPGAYASSGFTTAASTDTSLPTVALITPSPGVTGVGLNGQVVVVFSKSMNPSQLGASWSNSAISLLVQGSPQYFSASVSADNRTVVLSGLSLPASSVVTVAIGSGLTDLSGNPLAPFTSQFTTGLGVDTTSASVASQRPGNGATNVSTAASPVVLFVNKALNASSVQGSLHVAQNGQLMAGTIALVGDGQTIEFTPSTPWQYGAQVELYLDSSANDTDGNAVNAYNGTFTTTSNPATTEPTVANYSPAYYASGVPLNVVVDVQYSQPLNVTTVNASTVYLSGPSGALPFNVILDTTGMLLHLTPLAALTPSSEYCFGFVNLQGSNGVNAQNIQSCFTTGTVAQTKAPAVLAVSPASNLTNVPLNANIAVSFAGPVDPISVNGTTVQVSGGGMTSVPASISFTSDGEGNNNQRVILAPEAPLPPSTAMTLTVAGVTDVAGNPVAPQTTHFTTGTAAATVPATVLVTNPYYGATGVPVNTLLSVQASTALDATTVVTTSAQTDVTGIAFQLYDRTLNQQVAGTYSLSADATTAYFVPSSPLSAGDSFSTAYGSYGITDLAGNPLNGLQLSFATGFASSTTAPQAVGVSPASGLTQVPLNAQIVVKFNEPVDAESLTGMTLSTGVTAVPLTATLTSGNQVVTLLPVNGFLPNTLYTLMVAGVTDLSGNVMAKSFTSTFTTGGIADFSALSIVSIDPANGSSAVPLNVLVHASFSKMADALSIGAGTVQLYPYSEGPAFRVPGVVTPSATGMGIAFTPADPLLPQTDYCVVVSGVLDTEGQAQASTSSSCFTTGVTAAAVGPSVTAMVPASAATNVPLNAQVIVTLSGQISASSLLASSLQVTAGGITVPGSVVLSGGGAMLTYTTSHFAPSTVYEVSVSGLMDLAGNTMTPFTATFTTAPSAVLVDVSTGFTSSGSLITAGNTPDGHWTVIPTNSTPPAGTFSATGTPQPLLVAAPSDAGFYSGWPANGPNSDWVSINPDSTFGNTFGVYSTQFTLPGTSVPPNLCLVGAMGVDDNGQLGINGKPIMNMIDTVVTEALSPVNVPVSSYLVTGSNTLSLGWGSTDNSYEAFRLQAAIMSCSAATAAAGASVVSIAPANGASNVSVTSTVAVTFNEPVDPDSVNDQSIRVTANNTTVAGTFITAGSVVTFTPLSPLPANATVDVNVGSYGLVTDLAGFSGTGGSSQFTTSSTPDMTVPKVLSVTPPNGATNVGPNAAIVITFSKSMNPTQLSQYWTSNPISLLAGEMRTYFSTTVSADNTSVTLNNFTLPASTGITLAISSGLTDLSGNPLAPFVSQFSTAAAFDNTYGSVTSQRPGNGATSVSVAASPIVLFVSKPLNPNTVPGGVHVVQQGQVVSGTAILVGSQTIAFTPSVPWANGALVEIFTDSTVLDTDGNPLNPYQGTFTTITSPTAPQIVLYSPSYGLSGIPLNVVPDVVYNSPILASSVTAANVYLNGPQGNVSADLSLDSTGTILRLAPAAALAPSSYYCFFIDKLLGTNGLAAQNLQACFNTGTSSLTKAPTVLAVSPANKLANVPVNAYLAVLLSGTIDPATVNAATVQLSGGGTSSVPSTLAFSNNQQRVVITPEAPFPASTALTLNLSGITDLAGHAIAPQSIHFTTGTTAATSGPCLRANNPESNAPDVPVNAVVSVQSCTQLDATSVSGLELEDQSLNQSVAGSTSTSADATTAYFLPSAPMAAGHTFFVGTNSTYLTDVAGNNLSWSGFSFTTGFSTSLAGPSVLGVSPANGLKQVPINAQIVVQFSEPVDSESLTGVALTSGGSSVLLSGSLSSGNQILTLTPAAALLPNATYSLNVAGVTDLSGNAMSAAFTTVFTTGPQPDFSSPAVVAIDPANGASAVPLNALIRIGFSKAVDVISLGGGNIELYPEGYSSFPVSGSLTFSANGSSASFRPAASLQADTQYCISVNNVVDLEGNGLSGQSSSCFTTGVSAQSTGPAVTSVSPPNGTTGVPVNALVQLALSKPISLVSAGAGSIAITAGNQTVSGTVSAPTPVTLLFTPANPLASDTVYSVQASGFTDLAGNLATTFTSAFTTGSSSPVTASPIVTSISPANGLTNVSVVSPVIVTFSTAVNPLTVTTQSVTVTANGSVVAGVYLVNGATVTFTPATPFPASANVTVTVDAYSVVQDLAGNNAQAASSSFETAATVDSTAPTVLSINPSNGETGIGLNGSVVIVFSKSINPSNVGPYSSSSAISLLASDQRQSFQAAISADNRTVTLTNLNLPASSLVTVAISNAITDLSGNALTPFVSHFTTAAALDITQGAVVSQRPANGASGVSIAASPITLFSTKPLDAASIQGALHVVQNGAVTAGTISLTGNGQTITFTPAVAWQYGAEIEIFLDTTAKDTDGNSLASYHATFTTVGNPAKTAPAPVNGSVLNGATGVPLNPVLVASYSNPLASSSVNGTNVYLDGPNGPVPATVSLDKTGTLVQLKPASSLAANTTYGFYLYNLVGSNTLPAENLFEYFTTGSASQAKAATVLAVSPADKLTNVPLNANLAVSFSGPIDPLSINSSTVYALGGGSTAIPASITFTTDGSTTGDLRAVITPEAPLAAATAMSLTISGVTDIAGNAIAAQTTHFTTGSAPATAAPTVTTINPENQAADVPVNAALSLQSSSALDATTIVGSRPQSSVGFEVDDTTLNQVVAGSYSLSANAATAYFVPTTPFEAGHSYSWGYGVNAITDLAGNPLSSENFSFTTGFNASTAGPTVLGFSPSPGLKQVPVNAQLVVQFNEPVSAESLGGIVLSANGVAAPLSGVLGSGNQLLTLTPSGLAANTAYTLTVAGVTDLSGNAMTAPATSTFTTGALADFSTLTIVAMDPSNGATGVPLNAQVHVEFSKAVDAVSLGAGNLILYPSSVGSSHPVPGTFTLSPTGVAVLFLPSSPLEAETQYCGSISGIVDLEGNTLSGLSQTCFTTGATSQAAGPTVAAASPQGGATGVPVNAIIELGLSEPVSAVSVTPSSVVVSSGGKSLSGTISVPNSSTITFTPSAPLSPGTVYTVAAGGYTDLAGNSATAYTGAFTTGSSTSPVTSGPSEVSVSPANNTTGVSVKTPIVITFSASVNPVSVNSQSINVTANGESIAGTYLVNAAAATFTPLTPLPGNATVSVNVSYYSAVQDYAGNAASPGFDSFTTASTPDKTSPTVLAVTPSNGATGVGFNGQIIITFSKSMNPTGLTGYSPDSDVALLVGNQPLSFSASMSADNRTLVLSGLNLPPGSTVTLFVSGAATDLSGNALTPFTSQFSTAAAFDTTQGAVASQRPGNGATGVSTSATPVVLFISKPLNVSTIPGAVHVVQNGQVVTGTIAVTGSGEVIAFTPALAWAQGALVEVFVDPTVLDTDGNPLMAYHSTFTTAGASASTAPSLVNLSPMSGAAGIPINVVLDASYNEQLTPSSVTSSTVSLRGPGGAVPATVTLDKTQTLIHLAPTAALTANSTYYFSLNGLQGSNGLAAENLSESFTTGASAQNTAPSVVAVSPADKSTNVPLNANLGVSLSAPVDPLTIAGSSIQLSGGGASALPASISYSNGNKTVHVVPEAPLPASTTLALTLSGISDLAGNVLPAQTTHFTTGTAAQTAPVYVIAENPAGDTTTALTGVPTNALISLDATAPIDLTTVSSTSFQLYDTTLNATIAGTYSSGLNGNGIFLLPAATLTPSRSYLVEFTDQGITDLAGNALTVCCGYFGDFSFTTGMSPSATAPQVVQISPTSGVSQVPLNAEIVVAFSEPVSPTSLGEIALSQDGTSVGVALGLSHGSCQTAPSAPPCAMLSAGNELLTISPQADLLPATVYTINVAGVSGLNGNVMPAQVSSSFTTGAAPSLSLPAVSSVSPSNGATAVPLNSTIQIQFSKLMNPISLNTSSITVTTNGQNSVAGTVAVNAADSTATFTPANPLSPSTSYVVNIDAGASDLEGNPVAAFQSAFATASH